MAKKTSKRDQVKRAAEKAAEEAVEAIENESQIELFEDEGDGDAIDYRERSEDEPSRPLFGSQSSFGAKDSATEEGFVETDVFEEGFRRARVKGTVPRFHIRKNSQFLTVKGYPYSWEKLQADHGPGYYHVIAKAQGSGEVLKHQTEMIGDPLDGKAIPEVVETESKKESELAILTFLQTSQERADQRAAQLASKSENNLASVMQSITQAQQKSSEMMMQVMMESNKQTQSLMMAMFQAQGKKSEDPLTALLLKAIIEKKDEGFTSQKVMEMIEKARKDGEDRMSKTYDMIEKKAETLAEDKAAAMAGETAEDESIGKTMLKGFIPLVTKMLENPALIQQQAMQGAVPQRAPNPNQPMIPAPQHMQGQRPPQPRPAAVQPAPVQPKTGQPSPVSSPQAQDLEKRLRFQEKVLELVAEDIGEGLMTKGKPSDVAGVVLLKLEKSGLPRQTVVKAFTAKELLTWAHRLGVPDIEEANTWLKEFHESLEHHVELKKSEGPTPTKPGKPTGKSNPTRSTAPKPQPAP